MPPSRPTPLPAPTGARRVTLGAIPSAAGHRALIYGPGGIGKSTMATLAPGPVVFFDLDESLARLQSQLTRQPAIVPVSTWQELRESLQMEGWEDVKTLVIDSITKAEELCIAHTLATVKNDKGQAVQRIEEYGYGKGYQFVFDTFLPLLGDLDRHCRAGRHVILIAHDCVTTVPNPAGEDWLRYEPRLQSPNSGKGSVRLRVKEWADHCLFIGYDVAVTKEGKGQGSGTRTLYPHETPVCMAKSRTCAEAFAVEKEDATVWEKIIK